MTLQELHMKLKASRISDDKYYLHGLYGSTNDENKLALIIRKGQHLKEYEIYYKERGEKQSVKIFTIEDDACQYFYKRLIENAEIENRVFSMNEEKTGGHGPATN